MKTFKKLTATLLALAMTLALAVVIAVPAAAADFWNGTDVATSFAGGTGSEADPYQINTAAQLAFLATAEQIGASEGKYYKLTNDISLGDFQWTPIGANSGSAFKGNFDGDGHTVSGLKYEPTSNADEAGLFGHTIGATIKNVKVTGSKISGRYAGAIAGRAFGDTQIINCYGKIDWIDGVCIGGIAGRLAKEGGLIFSCVSESTIKQTAGINLTADHFVGGIVGVLIGTMRYCVNKGDVTGAYAGNAGDITKVYRFGGLVGTQGGSDGVGHVEYCVNLGNVSVATSPASTPTKAFAAGITAYANKAGNTIKNSYSVGTVTATTEVNGTTVAEGQFGAIVGCTGKDIAITDVYTNVDTVCGANNSNVDLTGIKVLTLAEMQGANALNNMNLGSTLESVLVADVEKSITNANYPASAIAKFTNYTGGKTLQEYVVAKVREGLSLPEGADIWVTADGQTPLPGSIEAINASAEVTEKAGPLADAVLADLYSQYKNDPTLNTTESSDTGETPDSGDNTTTAGTTQPTVVVDNTTKPADDTTKTDEKSCG